MSVAFGSGGSEPYARALRSTGTDILYLQKLGQDGTPGTATLDFARWTRSADIADLRLLASVTGPVLDIGCGPGRMVRAALDLGLDALGLDVSPAAIEVARSAGLPVFEGSVFTRIPGERHWQTVLLIDGNIGIGGDVDVLLARCADLLCATGELVIELHPDDSRDRTYSGRLVDAEGGCSASFPWAEIGVNAVAKRAARAGLRMRQAWSEDGRSFCRLLNTRR